MTPPRLYCRDISDKRVALDESEAAHAQRSLRLRAGDRVCVFDGRGHSATGRLCETSGVQRPAGSRRRYRSLAVDLEQRSFTDRPARRLTLIVAAPKGERLRWMIEKCTELSVTALILADFERSVVHVRPKHVEKLRRYAIEACKQCDRDWLPAIECGPAIEACERAEGTLFLADRADDAQRATPALEGAGDAATVVVGPEGGVTEAECERLLDQDARAIRLGPYVLRIETAALALAAVWSNLAR